MNEEQRIDPGLRLMSLATSIFICVLTFLFASRFLLSVFIVHLFIVIVIEGFWPYDIEEMKNEDKT